MHELKEGLSISELLEAKTVVKNPLIWPGLIRKDILLNSNKINIDPLDLIYIICNYFEQEPEKVFVKNRQHELVITRQLCMYSIKNLTKLSLEKIGDICGMKDHATVLHAVKTINNLLDTDKKLQNDFVELSILIDTYVKNVRKNRLQQSRIQPQPMSLSHDGNISSQSKTDNQEQGEDIDQINQTKST